MNLGEAGELAAPSPFERRDLVGHRRYTVEALKHSSMLVRDPAEADVILVNDYCYKLRWLAYVHAGGWLPSIQTEADEAEAGQTLIAVRASRLFGKRPTRQTALRSSSLLRKRSG